MSIYKKENGIKKKKEMKRYKLKKIEPMMLISSIFFLIRGSESKQSNYKNENYI